MDPGERGCEDDVAKGCGWAKLGRRRASTWDEPSSASAQIPWGASSPDLISAGGASLHRWAERRTQAHDASDGRGATDGFDF